MQVCHVLSHREGVSFDIDRLMTLYGTLGVDLADAHVAAVMRAIEDALPQLCECIRRADFARASARSAALSASAATVGMSTLSRVAADFAHACDRGDMAALAATLARLQRIAERSTAELCDLHQSLR